MVDIKNVLIMCCGNTDIIDITLNNGNIGNMGIEALKNRFLTIRFPDIESNLKTTIIEKYIKTNYSFLNYEKHLQEINTIVNNDKEPGLRKLMINIDSFVNRHASHEVFKDTIWDTDE